jgi:ubiquinone/menaquinone biosynthesis C-methylase UbiE
MADPFEVLKLLADPTRVRILALLAREELSVAELQDVLDMGQSRISSHLALLRQAEMVVDRKEGKKTFYSRRQQQSREIESLIDSALIATHASSALADDAMQLQRILNKRKEEAAAYFNSVAGRLSKDYCPGRTWEGIGHLLLHYVPAIRVVDLGAGEGLIAQLLARYAKSVICVDSSPRMVEVGSDLAVRNGFDHLRYLLGDIESVPLPDSSADLALLSQALHHAAHPQKAVAEAYRILDQGGRIVILDLLEHHFEQARELYADRWLGFSENTLYRLLQEVGFKKIEITVVSREQEAPHFQTVMATGIKVI